MCQLLDLASARTLARLFPVRLCRLLTAAERTFVWLVAVHQAGVQWIMAMELRNVRVLDGVRLEVDVVADRYSDPPWKFVDRENIYLCPVVA